MESVAKSSFCFSSVELVAKDSGYEVDRTGYRAGTGLCMPCSFLERDYLPVRTV